MRDFPPGDVANGAGLRDGELCLFTKILVARRIVRHDRNGSVSAG
jgi:hypothetical protein